MLNFSTYMAPLSTTRPSDLSQNAAMNFSLWKTLGTEMFLQSDQVNCYICRDGSGSILHWKDGSISCRVAKSLVNKCKNHLLLKTLKEMLTMSCVLLDALENFYRFFYKVAVMTRRGAGGMSWDFNGKKMEMGKRPPQIPGARGSSVSCSCAGCSLVLRKLFHSM